MLLENSANNEVKRELLRIGSKYLYQTPFPTKPSIFKLHGHDYNHLICVDGFDHSWVFDEKKYGKAIMNLKICMKCDYGEIEVFPPLENRMVIQ